MAVSAITNDVNPPTKKPIQSTLASLVTTSSNLALAASAVIGMASRNENRDAASRLRPSNNPAVMVAPERDVPGIRDRGLTRLC